MEESADVPHAEEEGFSEENREANFRGRSGDEEDMEEMDSEEVATASHSLTGIQKLFLEKSIEDSPPKVCKL